ncbi:hypothetical protein [Cellulomonas sp. PhB143]|uniref:hypothetical protein n=1 Tax=Cellulomonas sp. PhB143 TaxID=2485186 RepID=UPI000FB4865E|nr:hypothetical protein [Cellulomonas sp. PhB143]ROS76634.1 hypothetical protein EDF32_1455 [Cellulomonas sp. PhB143]
MSGPIGRGLVAGAAGTTVLSTVTYLDMALRGRDASTVPAQTVSALAERADAALRGSTLPSPGDLLGSGRAAQNRLDAVGAVAGTKVGLAIGVLASCARAAGFRTGPVAGAVLIGAGAMAATDAATAATGVSDPRTWSRQDWVADAVPHLAYGLTTHLVLDSLGADDEPEAARPTLGLLLRSGMLGLAAGARASLGLAGPVVSSRGRGRARGAARLAALAGVAGELIGDKQPSTPSRLEAPGPLVRVVSGALGAAALARRVAARPLVPMVVGGYGASVGTAAGAAWRAHTVGKVPDLRAALAEDAVALGLTVLACAVGRGEAEHDVEVTVVVRHGDESGDAVATDTLPHARG